jgi:hypothetical protein
VRGILVCFSNPFEFVVKLLLNYSAEDAPTDYFCNHNDPPHPALPRAGGREEPKDTATESATNRGVFMVLA